MPDLDPASVIEAIAADQRLRVFVRRGRIETLPAKRSRRRLLLDKIAQGFEPGLRYPRTQRQPVPGSHLPRLRGAAAVSRR
jgi:hypothetical protein